jgi:hypothetical protein
MYAHLCQNEELCPSFIENDIPLKNFCFCISLMGLNTGSSKENARISNTFNSGMQTDIMILALAV